LGGPFGLSAFAVPTVLVLQYHSFVFLYLYPSVFHFVGGEVEATKSRFVAFYSSSGVRYIFTALALTFVSMGLDTYNCSRPDSKARAAVYC
jgi:hypothetical protein